MFTPSSSISLPFLQLFTRGEILQHLLPKKSTATARPRNHAVRCCNKMLDDLLHSKSLTSMAMNDDPWSINQKMRIDEFFQRNSGSDCRPKNYSKARSLTSIQVRRSAATGLWYRKPVKEGGQMKEHLKLLTFAGAILPLRFNAFSVTVWNAFLKCLSTANLTSRCGRSGKEREKIISQIQVLKSFGQKTLDCSMPEKHPKWMMTSLAMFAEEKEEETIGPAHQNEYEVSSLFPASNQLSFSISLLHLQQLAWALTLPPFYNYDQLFSSQIREMISVIYIRVYHGNS